VKQTQRKYATQPQTNSQQEPPRPLAKLKLIDGSTTVRLRDGEVVLYRRSRSERWQARFKLFSRKWHRVTTHHTNIEYAIRAACEAYDEARFRERLGLPISTRSFGDVAKLAVAELRDDIAAGKGKSIYKDYITIIDKYLLPYFAKVKLSSIDYDAVQKYEQWRDQRMKKVPKASTLLNHAAAFNRIVELAVKRGWLSSNHTIPRLNTKGERSKARPAFNRAEVDFLQNYLVDWVKGGNAGRGHNMRIALRDYVEVLLYTGMRHGTEAMNIQWKHLEWHIDGDSKRYLRIWVSGKTGPRWLIARHETIPIIDRIRQRTAGMEELTLDQVLAQKRTEWLFALPGGERPYDYVHAFRRLMKASGLEKDPSGTQNRTLYSLRHTYATLSLIENNMDIHTLAKQMGTSIQMIEQHYSKLTPTLNAAKLAG
jgi:integrase